MCRIFSGLITKSISSTVYLDSSRLYPCLNFQVYLQYLRYFFAMFSSGDNGDVED